MCSILFHRRRTSPRGDPTPSTMRDARTAIFPTVIVSDARCLRLRQGPSSAIGNSIGFPDPPCIDGASPGHDAFASSLFQPLGSIKNPEPCPRCADDGITGLL